MTGAKWLSVPVISKNKRCQLVNEAKIDYSGNWQRKHIGSIQYAYANAPYFKDHFPGLLSLLQKGHGKLIDLNMDLIRYFQRALNISCQIIYSSEIKVKGEKTEKLVSICQAIEANAYLTGDAATAYLDIELFRKNNIAVEFHQYSHPEYPQLYGKFVPYLSVIDLLFNCGPKSLDYLSCKKEKLL